MKSPFPGMDPFMELNWLDLHASLITYIRDQLQDELPSDLKAQINERVVMEQIDFDESQRAGTYPDVSVVQRGGTAVVQRAATEEAGAVPDVIVQEDASPETETYIEIVNARSGSKLVTVIELLSPTNKLPSKGRESYLAKKCTYLQAAIQLVEIDLTREGDRRAVMPTLFTDLPEPRPAYVALVHRFPPRPNRPQREYYQLPMEKPLKPIRVPLRPTDEDVILRLQPLVELAYQKGRYGDIDYTQRLHPPLSYAEQAFLDQCLAARQQINS